MMTQPSHIDLLIHKLDLNHYMQSFLTFFARPKPITLKADLYQQALLLNELERIEFTPPPSIATLSHHVIHLQKHGVLHQEEIFEWVKMWRYMLYLQSLDVGGRLKAWWDKIVFPKALLDIEACFDEKGAFVDGKFVELDNLHKNIVHTTQNLKQGLYDVLHNGALQPFLVDTQLHLVDDVETLLVRGGFANVLKADIISRSSSGFFYVMPHSVGHLNRKITSLKQQVMLEIYRICAQYSKVMCKHHAFLSFIEREFDKFDHLQARVCFAKAHAFEFVVPTREKTKQKSIILDAFCHPAIKDAIPISIDFSKPLMLITGVNAGGKTMLLKSLLSAAFLSKNLLPMRINAHKSIIGNFRHIEAIVDDPQDVKNDISTFAGRMLCFSSLFRADKDGSLIGVDEIELGTDSDEAASLFKVLLERLLQKKQKIILTTHHKRLAALMSSNANVELIAALYDEQHSRPLFQFLQGTIGKSYAFETALRYQIPPDIIQEARKVYGEDQEKLNELIERSAELELELQHKNLTLQKHIQNAEQKTNYLQNLIDEQHALFQTSKSELEKKFYEAISLAKDAAKKHTQSEIHQGINNANKLLEQFKNKNRQVILKHDFKVGDMVKVRKNRGRIVSFKKDRAVVELDMGVRIHFDVRELKRAAPVEMPSSQTKVELANHTANVSLDLHGLRSDEAIERLDHFLSNALIAGFDEVLVYHGIGTGKLAFAVREFLKTHPKVRDFSDATPQLGGLGAKIVRL